jgi:hypothetical protein
VAFVLLTGIMTSMGVHAQKPVVYGELGGPGFASFNIDMRFSKADDGFGFRAGVGGFSLEDNDGVLTIPIGINYIASKDKKNYFETGVGVTYLSDQNSNNNDQLFGDTFGHLTLGYRRQRPDGGFFFRAALNPVFGKFGFFPFYGGVAFGYKF